MRSVLGIFVVILAQSAFAGVQVSKAQLESNIVAMTVTGEAAKALQKLTSDYEGQPDSYLAPGAGQDDYSSIRSIKCALEICTIVYSGDTHSNKDTEDYHAESFNRELRALSDNQVRVSPSARGLDGAPTKYEARLLRLMIENRNGVKGIKVKIEKPRKLKPDTVASSLYELSLKIGKFELRCYSSIVTGMGVTNFLEESCGINAVAELK